MDIIDFFNSNELELPKVRPQGDYEQFLDQVFVGYLHAIGQLTSTDAVTAGVQAALPHVQTLCNALRDSISSYFDGFPHGAYNHLSNGIQAVRPHLDRLASSPNIAPSLECMYRVRLGSLAKYQRPALFHIPFEVRHRVTTKRYSISGLPSLYLGGSLWVCWEEMGRPDFHTIHVSQFRPAPGAAIQVLDFGYRPALIAAMVHANQGVYNGGPLADFVISQAVCWPLIAACSIKVLHPGEPNAPAAFVPEYIVPQLLLQWLRNETAWDGLRYFSTRITEYVRDPTVPMNYVFPVRVKAAAGYCATLRAKFVLSDPIAWSVLSQAGLPSTHPRNPTWDMPLAEGVSVAYLNTTFFDCESKLALFPCNAV